ncbi:MAG: hypothetical protein WA946_13550 [Nitrospirota bacterium]
MINHRHGGGLAGGTSIWDMLKRRRSTVMKKTAGLCNKGDAGGNTEEDVKLQKNKGQYLSP